MLRYAVNRHRLDDPRSSSSRSRSPSSSVRSIDGDPFRHGPLVGLTAQGGWRKYGDYQPQSIRDNMRRRYGLDLPWYEQYGNYLAGVATLNLGPSLSYRNRTVEEIITTQGPVTLELAVLALAFAFALGIPIGLWSALTARSPLARLEGVTSSLALALPAIPRRDAADLCLRGANESLAHDRLGRLARQILPTITLGLVPLALLRTADPRRGARDAAERLCSHRPREGPPRPPRDRAARAAQLAASRCSAPSARSSARW